MRNLLHYLLLEIMTEEIPRTVSRECDRCRGPAMHKESGVRVPTKEPVGPTARPAVEELEAWIVVRGQIGQVVGLRPRDELGRVGVEPEGGGVSVLDGARLRGPPSVVPLAGLDLRHCRAFSSE